MNKLTLTIKEINNIKSIQKILEQEKKKILRKIAENYEIPISKIKLD